MSKTIITVTNEEGIVQDTLAIHDYPVAMLHAVCQGYLDEHGLCDCACCGDWYSEKIMTETPLALNLASSHDLPLRLADFLCPTCNAKEV